MSDSAVLKCFGVMLAVVVGVVDAGKLVRCAVVVSAEDRGIVIVLIVVGGVFVVASVVARVVVFLTPVSFAFVTSAVLISDSVAATVVIADFVAGVVVGSGAVDNLAAVVSDSAVVKCFGFISEVVSGVVDV